MVLILYLLLCCTVLYALVALCFFVGLCRLGDHARTRETPFISIVIAARNEADYIGQCLDSLKRQTYPADRFEVLVVDDDSTDNTAQIVASAGMSNLRLLFVDDRFLDMAAKKRPLSVGIQRARGEWILTTDADCTVPPTWVGHMASYMTADAGVVIGFSQLGETRSLFHRLQALDFFVLMAAAAGAAGVGMPLAASGQNFAYRKSLFERVGGFRDVAHRPSGDDVLLLQLLHKAWDGRIAFAADPGAFATTHRPETPASLWQQRKRWASNAAYQLRLNPVFFAYIAAVFTVNALIPIGLLLSMISGDYKLLLICWCGKLLSDLLVVGKGVSTFKRRGMLSIFPFWELAQIPYIIAIGLAGTARGFTWKERHHGRKKK